MAELVAKSLNGGAALARFRPARQKRYAILSGMSLTKLVQQQQPQPNPLAVLLTKISGGDEPALGKLYDATVSRVYGLAMKITLRRELAEEVVGDVYLQVWKKAA